MKFGPPKPPAEARKQAGNVLFHDLFCKLSEFFEKMGSTSHDFMMSPGHKEYFFHYGCLQCTCYFGVVAEKKMLLFSKENSRKTFTSNYQFFVKETTFELQKLIEIS